LEQHVIILWFLFFIGFGNFNWDGNSNEIKEEKWTRGSIDGGLHDAVKDNKAMVKP
jgi:hypothetical protein